MRQTAKKNIVKYVRKLKESTFFNIISNYKKYKNCCETMIANAKDVNNSNRV